MLVPFELQAFLAQPAVKLRHTLISIPTAGVWLDGVLAHAPDVRGLALIPESDFYRPPRIDDSRRARELQAAGFATMSLNLLTRHEAARDPDAGYNIARLTRRLLDTIEWCQHQPALAPQSLGIVAAGTGCAAAVRAAVAQPERIAAIVCIAGRADLAGGVPLRALTTPIRFIVAADDPQATICRSAFELIARTLRDWVEVDQDAPSRPPGVHVAAAAQWLQRHLPPPRPPQPEVEAVRA
jgi:hypothetical protein